MNKRFFVCIIFLLLHSSNSMAQSPFVVDYTGQIDGAGPFSAAKNSGLVAQALSDSGQIGSVFVTGPNFNSSVATGGAGSLGIISLFDRCSGGFTQLFTMSGTLPSDNVAIGDILVDDTVSNRLLVVGSASGNVILNPLSTTSIALPAGVHTFVSMFDLGSASYLSSIFLGLALSNSSYISAKEVSTSIFGVTVVGNFKGTVTFDPYGNPITVASLGTADFFVATFDFFTNSLTSLTTFGRANGNFHFPLAHETSILGQAFYVLNEDVGSGLISSSAGAITGAGQGVYDIVLISQDLATGSNTYVKHLSGLDDHWLYDLKVDDFGNAYLLGDFDSFTNLDPNQPPILGHNVLTSVGRNTFLAKYDPSGNLLWSRQFAPSTPFVTWIQQGQVAFDLSNNSIQMRFTEYNSNSSSQLYKSYQLSSVTGVTQSYNAFAVPASLSLHKIQLESYNCGPGNSGMLEGVKLNDVSSNQLHQVILSQ